MIENGRRNSKVNGAHAVPLTSAFVRLRWSDAKDPRLWGARLAHRRPAGELRRRHLGLERGGGDGSAADKDGGSSTVDGAAAGQDSGAAGSQDGGDAGSALDSGDAGPACDPTRPFNAPSPVTSLNSSDNDEVAGLSPNELELFVTSYPAGQNRKIKRFARADKQSPWVYKDIADTLSVAEGGAPTSATGLTFEPDGLIGYFQLYDKVGNPNASIFTTRRVFTAPVEVSSLSDTFSDETPFLTADGKTLYFFSNRVGGFHIFYADKGGNGFGAVTSAFKVLPTDDRYPVLTGDQLTMYLGAYGSIDGGAPATRCGRRHRRLRSVQAQVSLVHP